MLPSELPARKSVCGVSFVAAAKVVHPRTLPIRLGALTALYASAVGAALAGRAVAATIKLAMMDKVTTTPRILLILLFIDFKFPP
jgi:phosphate/sulfate permease